MTFTGYTVAGEFAAPPRFLIALPKKPVPGIPRAPVHHAVHLPSFNENLLLWKLQVIVGVPFSTRIAPYVYNE